MTINYEIGKPRKDRRMRITLLICIGKTKKRIGTHIFAMPSDLNRKGGLRNDSPISDKVRKAIRDIETEYSKMDTFLTGETLTAADAVELMRKTDIPTFFTYAERWLEKATMKGKKNYVTALNTFRSFLGCDIPFSAFSRPLINDFIFSLNDRPRAKSLYASAIKHIYTEAEKDYDIKPFASFRIDIPRQQPPKSRSLDISTIKKIFSYHGNNSRAILARDCAILSFCLCGTNSADLFTAPPIKNGTLSYNRQKTKDRRADDAYIEIIIPEQIKDLVRRYKGNSRAFNFYGRYSNESTFNQNINVGLRTIRKEMGIKEAFSFYSFRHSWASIARNDLGIDKWTIHCALNHNDRSTAIDDIYIRKDFRLINEANKKVVDYVFT